MKRRISVVVLLAFTLALAGCGGGDETSTTTTTETTETQTTDTQATTTTDEEPSRPTVVKVVVEGSVPKGGIVRQTVSEGGSVAIVVDSDVADEIHLHGYDLSRGVTAGGTARIEFQADVPGRFEVELEDRGVQIAELTVEP
jgi:ABC-type glycerol-3-phosphate transport system substrate-binding protein